MIHVFFSRMHIFNKKNYYSKTLFKEREITSSYRSWMITNITISIMIFLDRKLPSLNIIFFSEVSDRDFLDKPKKVVNGHEMKLKNPPTPTVIDALF